ncbi:hypothetical protein ZEAMMB73_Zm00001d024613 [Zea mays]|uniref:Uncharacterized protein n=1 Tax=Zea mays TaxID=4577 RepID=A0A1D6J0N5_MAIZE|nr:hypothetical protein ZEAMMB73_Zm00001d024613 [Zea mays]
MVDDARLSTVLSKEGIEVCMVPSADRPDDAKFVVPLLESDFDFAIAKLTIRLSSLNDFISCY